MKDKNTFFSLFVFVKSSTLSFSHVVLSVTEKTMYDDVVKERQSPNQEEVEGADGSNRK